jgi:phage-related protein (TIGR01555 family)
MATRKRSSKAKTTVPTRRALQISERKSAVKYPELSVPKPSPGSVPASIAMDAKHLLANDQEIRKVLDWAQSQGQMALDQNITALPGPAAAVMNDAFWAGTTFLGYTLLANLAQRPEYRRISEVLATTATDKWIEIKSKSSEKSHDSKIADITTFLSDIGTREAFKKLSEQDGFFGRSHLYLDTGDTENSSELSKSIGNGRDKISMEKIDRNHRLKEVRTIEPVWCYPQSYNSNNPLKKDWYNPQQWFCMGQEIHSSRLLKFVAREVPDILKPNYNFGGLSLTQMSMSYVNNWLAVRQGITDLILSFSYTILKTDLASAMQSGFEEQLQARIQLLTNWRSNKGTVALDKNEEFSNISTPLGTLDALQAQSQEQLCFASGTPVAVLFGITPQGLNASSEGEIRIWEKWVSAYQRAFFGRGLGTVIDMAQLSLYGAVDPDISYEFVPLREMSEKEEAEIRKFEAETEAIYVDMGAVGNDEVRTRLATDPTSIYAGLDVDRMPVQDDAGGDEGDQPEHGGEAGREPPPK